MEEKNEPRFSHSDLEFIVREHGLSVTGDLLASIAELSDAMEGEYSSAEDALEALSTFVTKVVNRVPLAIAVIESRLKAIEDAVRGEESAE